MADPFDEFVGIPFLDRGRTVAGADCWGLTRLALLKVAGLELPAYDEHYSSASERRINAEMIDGKSSMGDWCEVAAGSEQRFDVVVMRDGRFHSHMALVTRPGRMLHTYQGSGSCVDRYHNSPFREKVVAFYRHRSMIAATEPAQDAPEAVRAATTPPDPDKRAPDARWPGAGTSESG